MILKSVLTSGQIPIFFSPFPGNDNSENERVSCSENSVIFQQQLKTVHVPLFHVVVCNVVKWNRKEKFVFHIYESSLSLVIYSLHC